MAHPGFFFYTGDWQKKTRILSLEAKGAWIDLLSHLHEAKPRGEVTWSMVQLSRFLSVTPEKAVEIVCELESSGVANIAWQNDGKTCEGIANIANRRMIRDSAKEQGIKDVRSEAGKIGAAKRWQKWQPSSSSSISSSLNINKKPKKVFTPLPPDFVLTADLKAWAQERGCRNVEHEFETFKNFHLSKESMFKNWDAAFRTWIGKSISFGGPRGIITQQRKPGQFVG